MSNAKQMTLTGTREELRECLAQLEARGATGIIFGTTGYDVERELRAYAGIAAIEARRLLVTGPLSTHGRSYWHEARCWPKADWQL